MIAILVANTVYTYIIYLFMNKIFKECSSDKLTEVVSYVLFVGSISLFYNYESGLEAYFVLLGMLFVVSFNYVENYFTRVYVSLLLFLFTCMMYAVIQTICSLFIGNVLNNGVSIIILISRFLMVLLYIVFSKSEQIIYYLIEVGKGNFSNFVVPMISLFIMYNLFMSIGITIWIILDIICLCIINIVVFYMSKYIKMNNRRKREDELIRQQNIYYNMQFELMRENNERMRSFRHDFKNHIMYLQKCTVGCESIKEYDRIAEGILSEKEFANSGNLVIDSILNCKINQAVNKGFDFKLKLIVPEQLNVKDTDFVILFGNIIDNAIEHCIESNKEIRMRIQYDSGMLYIDSSNASKKINIVEGKIISSKEDKKNHGIGLNNIRAVVDQYNGEVTIDYKEDRFRISILIPC